MSNPNQVTVSQINEVTTVEIATVGPQGPSFSSTGKTMTDENVTDGSVIVYKQSSGNYESTPTHTILTLVDGGNY